PSPDPLDVSPALAPDSGSDSDSQPAKADRPYWRTNVFKRAFVDQKFVVVHWWPSEFRRWTFTVPIMLGTAAALSSSHDERGYALSLQRRIDNRTGNSSDHVAGYFTRLGNGVPMMMLLGTSYFFARRAGSDRMARTSSLAAEALLNVGVWSVVLKAVAART